MPLGMFGFGNKLKSKLSATRFEFTFVVHSLTPWPEGNRAIAIGYQRGKRRRGATRSVYPSKQPGRLGAVVRFNEKFEMPVTLYKANGNSSNGGTALGPFKKKCLILAVLETDGRTQATAALGRVVVDLSEYASIEHQETRTFMVTCNKGIHAAVGDPQLMLTIRCRWKKTAAVGGNGQALDPKGMDDTASMSTDTTGSRMTANLSSFLRFRFNGKNEEQDLRGFDAPPAANGSSSAGGAAAAAAAVTAAATAAASAALLSGKSSNYMDTIQESHDEPADQQPARITPTSTPSRMLSPSNSQKPMLTPTSSSNLGPMPSPSAASGRTPVDEGIVRGHSLSPQASGPLEAGVIGGMSLRQAYAKAADSNVGASRRDDHASTADSVTSTNNMNGSFGARPYTNESATDRTNKGMLTPSGSEGDTDGLLRAMRAELLSVAAAEAAIYLVQPAVALSLASCSNTAAAADASAAASPAAPKDTSRVAHAPARRLARTVLCMGPHDGAAFGASALRLLNAQVASAGDSVSSLAFWWSNVVHLRAMLQGLSLAAATGMLTQNGGSSGHWASFALVPDLQRLERRVFDEMLGRLWDRVLLPTVVGTATGRGSGAAGAVAASAKPIAATKRAQQEAAIKKWFEGLEAVSVALARLGSGGHIGLLRQQVLLQCLKRLDALMFFNLLGGSEAGAEEVLAEYDPHGTLFGGKAGAPGLPHLEEAALPFAKGGLTFGGGMGVKMTVTRLQQWAASEPALVGDGAATAAGGSANALPAGAGAAGAVDTVSSAVSGAASGPLFPLLRAAADLLMMPKELLMDKAIRLDMGSSLSMRSVIFILERFQPDEFAHDTINPAILQSLQEESALPLTMRSPAADINGAYRAPPDSAVMAGVEAGREPGLEYDADSEDELESMGQVVSSERGAAQGSLRFKLLHDLWVAGVPRRRAVTLQS